MAVPYDVVRGWDDMAIEVPARSVSRARAAARPALLAIAAAMATTFLLASTGFRFGVGHNIYHIPLVLNLGALPQFAHDQFYQDLHWIVSYVWPLEHMLATESNAPTLF